MDEKKDKGDEAWEALLSNGSQESFRPGFEDRVMRRIAEAGAVSGESVIDWIRALFPRLVLPAAAISIVLLANNYRQAIDGTAVVDALFGLPDPQIFAELSGLGLAG
ncbi:MAG: hypothetical protein AAGG55_08810 [Pseudomonadota bacterium]